jgi:DNA replicative helicase MCM subunit Mcm2 (Cdc46/Mcm family)
LSQAMARLHFRDIVTKEDVIEADRLLFESKRSTTSKTEKKAMLEDPTSAVFRIFQQYGKEMKTADIK